MNEMYENLIKSLWENGEKEDSIIKMLPFDKQTSQQMIDCLKKKGVILENRKRKSIEDTKKLILEAYQSGMTNPYEIAEKYGYSKNTITTYLVELHLGRKRPAHNYNKSRQYSLSKKTESIIESLKSGLKSKEIQEMYKVSRQYVHYVKYKYLKG